MPPVGFEPTISAGERPQTYALGRAAKLCSLLTYCDHVLYAFFIIPSRKIFMSHLTYLGLNNPVKLNMK